MRAERPSGMMRPTRICVSSPKLGVTDVPRRDSHMAIICDGWSMHENGSARIRAQYSTMVCLWLTPGAVADNQVGL